MACRSGSFFKVKMNLLDFIEYLKKHADAQKATQMAAYMKHHFVFLGIQSPHRKLLQADFLASLKTNKSIDWPTVFTLFDQPEREFQMVALDYLAKNIRKLQLNDLPHLEKLIQTKSWWDSVDGMHKLVGFLSQKYPQIIETHIKKWMVAKNMWLRRIAIDFQIGLKNKTNTDVLEEVILSNFGTKQFFINKAIGWSLRDYARHNPGWVVDFVRKYEHEMHPLSVREALKHFKK